MNFFCPNTQGLICVKPEGGQHYHHHPYIFDLTRGGQLKPGGLNNPQHPQQIEHC